MANGNQAMMEQAMMQGAMDMGAGPALAQGDTTPEEQAGRGGDTLLSHLTPGEIVIPKELIETEIDRRKIQSIFDKQGLDINQFTVGHESNSVNPETGYPEFGFGSWVRKQIRSVSKPIQKGWDYARYKRQRQKAEQSARAGAAQEGAAAQARIDRLMKQWEGKLSAAKIKYEAEAKAKRRKFAAQSMVQGKKFAKKLGRIKKEQAGIGAPIGVTDSAAAAGYTPTRRKKSSWRRSRKRALRVRRRPGQ